MNDVPNMAMFSYYIGITSKDFPDPDAGKPELDFFLEIPPDVKLTVCASELTCVDTSNNETMEEADRIQKEISVIRIRARYNNLMTCLIDSPCQLTRDQISILIRSIEKERLMEARCLL